ncbi:MAG: fibronectin type III domain-containing protein [Ruminococcus sp.]|nr:fibronectin type III domain-containing protein [Ruminococcus sp.]
MNIRRIAVCAALALLTALQSAPVSFAQEAQDTPVTAAADTAADDTGEIELTEFSKALYAEKAADIAQEEQFLDCNPELKELGEYVFEGDTLPCSENDPSYHKYIKSIMESTGEGVCPSLTGMGVRLLTAEVAGASSLVHQDRYKDCVKTYGIDVSYYQGKIDWNKVKAEGFTFCILRAGFRGYGAAGTLVVDDRFLEYLKGAKAAGMEVGVYFYTQAITVAEAREEADFVYKYIKGTSLELPVYFDMETVENAVGRLDSAGLTKAQKTDIVEAFCDRIKALGYEAGVYSNPQWLTYYLDSARLQAKYPLWLANYTTNTKYAGNFNIWQYGAGYVNGVSSARTDVNVRYHTTPLPAKVTSFTTAAPVSDKAVLSWAASENATGYELFRQSPGKDPEMVIRTKGTSYQVSLTSSRDVFFVRAYTIYSGKYIYGESSDQLEVAAYTPADLRYSGRSYDYITLRWSEVKDAYRYRLYMYNEETGKYALVTTTENNYFKVTGLEAAKLYKFKVRAVTLIGGTKTTRAFGPVTVIGTQGLKMTGLKFVTKTENSVSLKWDASECYCEGYDVLMYDEELKKYIVAGSTQGTAYTVTGLTQGKSYKFKVRSFYANDFVPGQMIYSLHSAVLTCATKCAAPTNCKTTSTDSAYTITWKAPAGATGYMIYSAPAGSTPVQTAEVSTTSYTATGLSAGIYNMYVRPYIKCGSTRYYGVSSPTMTAVLGKAAPTGVEVSAVGETTATVSWKAAKYAEKYQVCIYNSNNKTYDCKATLASGARKFTFTGLSAGTNYKFAVAAQFPDGAVYYSELAAATTDLPPAEIGAPQDIKATTATDSTVTVIWGAVKDARNYRIYIYDEATQKYKLKVTTTKTTYTFTGLSTAVLYKIKIYSVPATGSAKASEVYTITPKPAAPTLGLSSKTENTATLKWNAVPLCTKYYIYKLDPLEHTYVKIATTTATSYTVKGLTTGTRNIFKIKSVVCTNAANFNSLYSAQLSVLTRGLEYFAPCSAGCETLYQAFDELGLEKSYAYQEKIAIANAIKGYEGTAEQNTAMLQTLKSGKLIKPQF